MTVVRRDLNRVQRRSVRVTSNTAPFDPVAEDSEFRRVPADSNSAAVWHSPRGFLQEQTVFRKHSIRPSAAAFLSQCGEVRVRIKSEDRQLEAILPFSLTVASRTIASKTAQHRQNVSFKMYSTLRFGASNNHRH